MVLTVPGSDLCLLHCIMVTSRPCGAQQGSIQNNGRDSGIQVPSSKHLVPAPAAFLPQVAQGLNSVAHSPPTNFRTMLVQRQGTLDAKGLHHSQDHKTKEEPCHDSNQVQLTSKQWFQPLWLQCPFPPSVSLALLWGNLPLIL